MVGNNQTNSELNEDTPASENGHWEVGMGREVKDEQKLGRCCRAQGRELEGHRTTEGPLVQNVTFRLPLKQATDHRTSHRLEHTRDTWE